MKILVTNYSVINLDCIRYIRSRMGEVCGIVVYFDKEDSVFLPGPPKSLLLAKLIWAMCSEESNICIDVEEMRHQEKDHHEESEFILSDTLIKNAKLLRGEDD